MLARRDHVGSRLNARHNRHRLAPMLLRAAYDLLSPAGERGRITILTFHRIHAARDPLMPLEPDSADFARKMTLLRDHFNVLSLTEAVERLRRRSLPARCACVTFDDGYKENIRTAVPTLERLRLPATFFVTTGYIDHGRMWNDHVSLAVRRAAGPRLDLRDVDLGEHDVSSDAGRAAALHGLIDRLKYVPPDERQVLAARIAQIAGVDPNEDLMMSKDDIRQLARSGMEIGAHTRTHPILTRIAPEQARDEIAGSRHDLESIAGVPVRAFAYPNGRPGRDYDASHVALVHEAGFTSAVTTAPGIASAGSDLLQLPRQSPWTESGARFAFRLLRDLSGRRAEQTVPRLGSMSGPVAAPRQSETAPGEIRRTEPATNVAHGAPVRRLMLIEEGIGFGGAAVCAKKLMRHAHRWSDDCLVASTVPVGLHDASPVVRDLRLVRRELVDFKPLKDRLQARPQGAWRTSLLRTVARLDDLVNFLPRVAQFVFMMARYRPTVVHTNNEPFMNRVPCIAARLLGIPIVAHVRGEVAYMLGKHRWSLSMPAHIIVVSAWLRDELVGAGVSPERCHLIYDGLPRSYVEQPSRRAEVRQRLAIDESTLVITLVGMLVQWKGQMLALDAIERIAADLPDFRLVFVGASPSSSAAYENMLRKRAARSSLSGNVMFTGLWSDTSDIYDASDIVLSTSLEPEPFGLVVLEAIGRGCAVVAPAWGGAAEVVEDGVSGLLFKPGDAASLAQAIRTLAGDERLRERLGKAGRARALAEFDDDVNLGRLVDVYRQTIQCG